VVCDEQEAFGCLLEEANREKCQGLLAKGPSFGVPSTAEEISEQCSSKMEAKEEVSEEKIISAGSSDLDALLAGNLTLDEDVAGESSHCRGRLIGMAARMAPGCLEQCESKGICSAMQQAISAYLPRRNKAAVWEVVCDEQEAFGCLLEEANREKCQGLLAKGPSFGFPTVAEEISGQCSSKMEAKEEIPEDKMISEASSDLDAFLVGNLTLDKDLLAESSHCRGRLINMAARMAPGCLEQCESKGICEAVQHAITAYMPRRNKAAVWEVVCDEQEAFSCLLEEENREKCQGLLEKGPSFGVPTTMDEISSQCP